MNNVEQALSELLSAAEKFIQPHSGLFIDFSQEDWPVTEQSCQCDEATAQGCTKWAGNASSSKQLWTALHANKWSSILAAIPINF